MSDQNVFMQADAALERDLKKAATPEEIRELLERAVSRSNLGVRRDEQTGRFVSAQTAETQPPAEEQHEDAGHVFSKVLKIHGQEITVEAASELELERQVTQAYRIAEAVRPSGEEVTPRQRQSDAAVEAMNQVELKLQFQRGEISPADYIEKSGALDSALAARGFDLEAAANKQTEQDWAAATDEFLNGPGSDWPGGAANLKIIGTQILAMGLQDAPDKVAALSAAWEEMKKDGTVISPEPTEEQLIEATNGMSPTEIIEKWKTAQGYDPEKANDAFVRQNSSSGSGLFGK